MYKINDKYSQRAKKEGYLARSVFKLEEIDSHYKIFKKNDTVLDLGAAPGSWLQYISKKIKPRGLVVGIDKQSINLPPAKNIKTVVGDVFEIYKINNLPPDFDVIVSDLAPATTGTKFADSAKSLELLQTAFSFAQTCLKPSGHFVGKIFASPEELEFFKKFSKFFSLTKRYKPTACRESSKELYIIGKNFKKTN